MNELWLGSVRHLKGKIEVDKGKSLPHHVGVGTSIVSATRLQADFDVPEELEAWYSAEWRGSRSGSRASRGFHFQDAVGAWLASRMVSGDLTIDSLVPEGFDDLQLDAPESVQIEVKSRQGRLGRFPIGTAANQILDAWVRHADRFGTSRRLVVVFEQGIAGLG